MNKVYEEVKQPLPPLTSRHCFRPIFFPYSNPIKHWFTSKSMIDQKYTTELLSQYFNWNERFKNCSLTSFQVRKNQPRYQRLREQLLCLGGTDRHRPKIGGILPIPPKITGKRQNPLKTGGPQPQSQLQAQNHHCKEFQKYPV